MNIYQIKHKSRGRYGIVMPNGEWLEGFLGDKQTATLEADKLNQQTQPNKKTTVENTTTQVNSNTHQQFQFTLTKKGWLKKGV